MNRITVVSVAAISLLGLVSFSASADDPDLHPLSESHIEGKTLQQTLVVMAPPPSPRAPRAATGMRLPSRFGIPDQMLMIHREPTPPQRVVLRSMDGPVYESAGCTSCGAESPCDACDMYSGPITPRYLPGVGAGRFRDLKGFSVRAEYLLWWVNGFDIPPLLTTSTTGTGITDAGVLGLASTRVVAGNESLQGDERSGGRFTLTYWLDCGRTSGIEAVYTGLANETSTLRYDSQQFPILARPFFNIENGVAGQDSELIAYPSELVGNATIVAESEYQAIEVLYRQAIQRGCGFRLDGLIGWRHNRLNESLQFSDFKRVTGSVLGLDIGTTLAETDRFATENDFDGLQLGISAQSCYCGWMLEGLAKLALGNNHSLVRISGDATFDEPGPPHVVTTAPDGLLALGTNRGTYESDDFAVIPELGVTLGYDFNPRLRGTLGYTFMYWSRVARPGDQTDTTLNLTQLDPTGLSGAARPAPTYILTDVWAQGLRFGLDCRF